MKNAPICRITQSLPFQHSLIGFVCSTELTVQPTNVMAISTSITSILVTWDAIKFNPLDGYVVWCKEVASGLIIQNMTLDKANTSLNGLKELTNYSIEVAGYNAWERGPRSGPVYVKTEHPGKKVVH